MEQKRAVEAAFLKTPDLISITREVFGDDTLKGSSREGKAVRDHLVEKGCKYRTTKHKKAKPIKLTDAQKDEIESLADEGESSFKIAQQLFPNNNVKKLGLEQRAVMDHIKSVNPDFGQPQCGALSDYSAPNAPSRIVSKINAATGEELNADKLSRQHQICVDRLGIRLRNSRFNAIINTYRDDKRRELFEQEFIRLTWDKPDLTADEVNLYMNVCKELIHMEIISAHLEKLNEEFDNTTGQTDMSMRLAEMIKTKSDEYHKCEGRIENLTKKLQGDRAERMKKRHQDNASILSIVQMFQDEKERKNMVRIAELQKEVIKEEADRLESMDMFMARVLGATKDELT